MHASKNYFNSFLFFMTFGGYREQVGSCAWCKKRVQNCQDWKKDSPGKFCAAGYPEHSAKVHDIVIA